MVTFQLSKKLKFSVGGNGVTDLLKYEGKDRIGSFSRGSSSLGVDRAFHNILIVTRSLQK